MSESEQAIREAFLSEAIKLHTPGDVIVYMEHVADGIIAALKKYDEIALEVRRTGKPSK